MRHRSLSAVIVTLVAAGAGTAHAVTREPAGDGGCDVTTLTGGLWIPPAVAAAQGITCSPGTTPSTAIKRDAAPPQGLSLMKTEGQNGAKHPATAPAGAVVAAIPAGVKQAPHYRSEGFLAQNGTQIKLGEGQTLTLDMTITPRLNGVETDPTQWSVMWQLQGPMTSGAWPAPTLTVAAQNGQWRVGGGAGVDGKGKVSWAPTRPVFKDGAPARWQIKVVLSSDPGKGSVTASLNGAPVATNWHPPAGTLYPGQAWVGIKTGLYTGGLNGKPANPTPRTVNVDIEDLTIQGKAAK